MQNKRNRILLPVLILLAVAVGAGVGSTAAKYVRHQKMTGRVTFTAKLADSIQVLEHKAGLVNDHEGSNYKLTSDPTDKNEYFLMPGVDIPKDPYVLINQKTSIPAYLYIEIADNTYKADPDEVKDVDMLSYSLTDSWIPLEGNGIKPQNGGKVYYHKEKLASFTSQEFPVLADKKVIVSDTYLSKAVDGDVIKIYAYLYEVFRVEESGVSRDASPAEVYMANNP